MISETPLGPWLPDLIDFKNGGLEVCKNVIPSAKGYQPARAAVAVGGSVTGNEIGSFGAVRADGTPVICIATTTDIFTIIGGTTTASGLGLSLDNTAQVVFEQFNSAIYATTKTGAFWVLGDIATDTTFAASTSNAPSANAMGRVGDFLLLGDITDIDSTDAPYRLRWAPYNNPQGTWGTDIATQSDAIDLDPKYGKITSIKGGSFGLVFQELGVTRINYTGGTSVFAKEEYEENRGCAAPASAVRVGDIVYYLSLDGFFSTDGSAAQSISQGRIWDWFSERVNATYLPFVEGAVDMQKRCIVWAFPSGDTLEKDIQLWYNWETGQWSPVYQATGRFVPASKSGQSLEQLAVDYPNLDTMDVSLDSPIFRASGRSLMATVDGVLSDFTGPSLEACFGGGDVQPQTGYRSFVSEVTPLVSNEDENTLVSLGTRDRMTQSVMTSDDRAMGPLGFVPFNSDARYFRVNMTIPAGTTWADAFGYQVNFEVSGRL